MNDVGRMYHAVLTMQWPMPTGFNCSTVERTFTTLEGTTREAVFRDMSAIASDLAVESGCSSAKTGAGSVLFFSCEPNQL